MVLVGTGLAFAIVLLLAGPIPQDPAYHAFADARSLCGVDNFGNVSSNLPFVLVGMMGLWLVVRAGSGSVSGTFVLGGGERLAWGVAWVSVVLTGFGSAYYHLLPTNDRLFWDRLPMATFFMSLLSV